MIQNVVVIALLFLLLESFLLWLSSLPSLKKFFDIVPLIFLLFASAMLLANLGVIDQKSTFYQSAIDLLLPMALFIMLISVDIRNILHLGPMALASFLLGMLGVMIGMVLTFLLLRPMLGDEFAYGFAALTGSWTGGSANMIAIKEVLGVPDKIFTLMLIIDSTIPYVWMAILIFISKHQHHIDEYNHAEKFQLHGVDVTIPPARWQVVLPVLLIGFLASVGITYIGKLMPVIKGVFSAFTWTIVLVTIIALSLGVTRLGKWVHSGIGPWGQWVLFYVLLCIGTKGDLSQISTAPLLLLGGLIVLIVHGAILYGLARWMKVPLFLLATASQANLGGVASASMVAQIYRPGMAGVGLLMAILGNILGTYAGLIVFYICRLFP